MILPVKLSHMPTSRARDSSRLSEPEGRQKQGGFHPRGNGHTSQKLAGVCQLALVSPLSSPLSLAIALVKSKPTGGAFQLLRITES